MGTAALRIKHLVVTGSRGAGSPPLVIDATVPRGRSFKFPTLNWRSRQVELYELIFPSERCPTHLEKTRDHLPAVDFCADRRVGCALFLDRRRSGELADGGSLQCWAIAAAGHPPRGAHSRFCGAYRSMAQHFCSSYLDCGQGTRGDVGLGSWPPGRWARNSLTRLGHREYPGEVGDGDRQCAARRVRYPTVRPKGRSIGRRMITALAY